MHYIIQGGIVGLGVLLMILALLYKLPKKIRLLLYGHALVSDILVTGIIMSSLPLVGITALIGGLTFCILFSIYLFIGKSLEGYSKIKMKKGLLPFKIINKEESGCQTKKY